MTWGPLSWLDDASLAALLAAHRGTAYPKDQPVYGRTLTVEEIETEVRARHEVLRLT